MNSKILCVDDDMNILAGFQRNLRKQFTLDTALSGLDGLRKMEQSGPYAVLVSDMRMPGLNGVDFLNTVSEKYPDTVRIMLTGNSDQQTAMEAVNRGRVFQFLTKPCSAENLALTLNNALKQHRLIVAERELIENTLNGSIRVLTEILSLMDPEAFGRSQRVREHAKQVAQMMELPFAWELELGALLYHVGYVSVPAAVLQKVSQGVGLTGAEKDVLSRVPQVGSNLLSNIPRLEKVAKIVLYAGKHFDGSGFPKDDVKGGDIPIESRIVKVLADLCEYESKKVPRFRALEWMRDKAGAYDPMILDATARVFELDGNSGQEEAGLPCRFSELRPGQVLAADVTTKQDVMLVRADTRITPMLLERLKNFAALDGLKEPIYIVPEEPELEEHTESKPLPKVTVH